jgi:hypothetical protein
MHPLAWWCLQRTWCDTENWRGKIVRKDDEIVLLVSVLFENAQSNRLRRYRRRSLDNSRIPDNIRGAFISSSVV